MSESSICATERTEKPNKVRKQGFIPGVVYGRYMAPKSIKLAQKELKSLLYGHTRNAKVSVKLGNEVMQCIIKEVQKDPVDGQVLHVEMQTVHSDDLVRLKVPVIFYGKEKLPGKQLLLQEYIPEIEVEGRADILPEFVSVDVGDRGQGDKITAGDVQAGDGIRVLAHESEVLAVITGKKEYSEES